MASPRPISLLALATLVVVVASLSIHPSSAYPAVTYACGQTQYKTQCKLQTRDQRKDSAGHPPTIITIELATHQRASYGVKACPELPGNATLANIKAAYQKCAEGYESLQGKVLQTRKYSAAALKQHERTSSSTTLNMAQPQEVLNTCPPLIQASQCWEMH